MTLEEPSSSRTREDGEGSYQVCNHVSGARWSAPLPGAARRYCAARPRPLGALALSPPSPRPVAHGPRRARRDGVLSCTLSRAERAARFRAPAGRYAGRRRRIAAPHSCPLLPPPAWLAPALEWVVGLHYIH